MEALAFTPSTIILLVIILACVGLAIRRLARRGMCDCGDHCEEGGCHGCHDCKGCEAAEEMVRKMNS